MALIFMNNKILELLNQNQAPGLLHGIEQDTDPD